jgi:hypothetical protein
MTDQPTLSSAAKVTTKKIGYAPDGTLMLMDGRLSFDTEKEAVFDVPLESVRDIKWPRLGLGAACSFTIEGKRYSCSFADTPRGTGIGQAGVHAGGALEVLAVGRAVGNIRRVMKGKEVGAMWKAYLEQHPPADDSSG